jgi:membrane-associated phospholipid phosphatase
MQHPMEKAGHLAYWEPWVRAAIIDFDLVSHLNFSVHPETTPSGNKAAATLWHWNVSGTPGAPKATAARVATIIRPPKPVFELQLKFLDDYSDLREDRAAEILAQTSPQYAFWSSVVHLHPERTRKTIELLGAALRLANYAEMRMKHALACRRPIEYSSQVQPLILTPGHGSLPSGHSTETHMVARILWELRRGRPNDLLGLQLMRQANRIAVNRTVAGVHFPVDSAAGQLLGLTLARYFVRRATGAGTFYPWRFNGAAYPGAQDFDYAIHYDTTTAQQQEAGKPWLKQLPGHAPAVSPVLKWLWDESLQEWA